VSDIVSLLLPFFGLIFIGYIAGKVTKQPAEALGWMNTFIIYAALPALFFKLVSRTPFEDLTRVDFIATDLAATYSIFIVGEGAAGGADRLPRECAAFHRCACTHGSGWR